MTIDNLKMPPFETTLMGVVKGVLDYNGIEMTPEFAFGGSGHAFLINIHEQLCPSGPYCWNAEPFYALLRNLGLEMTDLGFFDKGSSPAVRSEIEQKLKRHLDNGLACSLCNMENQIINGYDDKQFFIAVPWMCAPEITPTKLSFGTWSELGAEVHINFFVLRKVPAKDSTTIIRESLSYAQELFRNPEKHTSEKYGVGPRAYERWERATPEQLASHGNLWNATVWAECREMASGYFAEIAGKFPNLAAPAQELSRTYKEIAGMLTKVANKETGSEEKVSAVRRLKDMELAAINKVEEFARAFA